MVRYFSDYSIEAPENKEDNLRVVNFFKAETQQTISEEFREISMSELVDTIKKHKVIEIENTLIQDFSLSRFKNLNLNLNRFKAGNSLFINKDDDIDFANIKLSAPEIDFSDSIFIAPGINFSDTIFESKDTNFNNCVFKSENYVSFKNTEFTGECNFKHTIFSDSFLDFSGVKFSDKPVDFTDAEFNNGDVLFVGAKFGNARTSFKIARFGEGRIDFSQARFGKNITSFEKAEFGNGDILFQSAVFNNGPINFISVNFGNGKKNFTNTNFGNCRVEFKNSNFGNGKTSFRLARFGKGVVDFHYSHFGKGDIIFDNTAFEDGLTDFRGVKFGTGKVSFKRSAFGNGDINFSGSELESGKFSINNAVLGTGEFTFEEADYRNADVSITNVNFGIGKVSFKDSYFNILSLKSSQLNNYFDLKFKRCHLLDLSDTVVKDILDIAPFDTNIIIENIKLSGMRLLGRIYIDWRSSNVKDLIYRQNTTHKDKEEQFRILKENFSSNGQYSYEDEAYVEFKRCEAKAHLENDKAKGPGHSIFGHITYNLNLLIFDKMGKYATAPLRVLFSMLLTYLLFTSMYIILAEFGDVHIISSLFDEGDPRILSKIGRSFYHSAITFLTIGYGDYYPDGVSRWISSIEGFVGLFQMSYFTVAFARKTLR